MNGVRKHYFIVALIGAILFIPFLGQVPLFDWDEINFAESAREMIASGDYFRVQINFQPFWEKPPLFIWMQVLSMKVFGINEFAARFPNAVCGIATLLVIFHIGRLFCVRNGYIWVACFVGAFTPHLYFKSGIIDPTFNLFIFLGIYQLYRASLLTKSNKRLGIYALAGMFLGLAVLTKGPAAAAVTLLCVVSYWVVNKFRFYFTVKEIIVYTLTAIVVASVWFAPETINNGFFFLREFIVYQIDLFRNPVASHGQPVYYHPIVLLLGCFPVSVISFLMFRKNEFADERQKTFIRWMLILFWVVLVLFSIVKTKIVHYSSLCYLPLTFLAAYTIEYMIAGYWKWPRWLTFVMLVIGLVLAAALTFLPLAAATPSLKAKLLPLIKDPFAVANFSQNVAWGGWEWLIGVLFFAAIVVGCVLLWKEKYFPAFTSLLAGTMITLQLYLYVVVPKIEQYSQGAAIQFWESLQDKDVYAQPLGYDTYAHYYYARVEPWGNLPPAIQKPAGGRTVYPADSVLNLAQFKALHETEYKNSYKTDWFEFIIKDWLLTGAIDKPAYFCCHLKKADEFAQNYPHLKRIGAKGGFVFFVREL